MLSDDYNGRPAVKVTRLSESMLHYLEQEVSAFDDGLVVVTKTTATFTRSAYDLVLRIMRTDPYQYDGVTTRTMSATLLALERAEIK